MIIKPAKLICCVVALVLAAEVIIFVSGRSPRGVNAFIQKHTAGVTAEGVTADFYERQEQFDRAALLLYEHRHLFLELRPGSTKGFVYRSTDPDWSKIRNGTDWSTDEWEAVRAVLDSKGLMEVAYYGPPDYLYPQVTFVFYLENDDPYEGNDQYELHRCIAAESSIQQCADEQLESRVEWWHSFYERFPDDKIRIPLFRRLDKAGWYATWEDHSD